MTEKMLKLSWKNQRRRRENFSPTGCEKSATEKKVRLDFWTGLFLWPSFAEGKNKNGPTPERRWWQSKKGAKRGQNQLRRFCRLAIVINLLTNYTGGVSMNVVKIWKIGNSHVVTLDKETLAQACMKVGDQVKVTAVDDGTIKVESADFVKRNLNKKDS